tara:strand:+ start:2319 stop:2495 length:177 start_codon:yes stop_codon:yes gene_type:complete
MKKKIRSISLSKHIDEKLLKDSQFRGLTVSANISRILHEYLIIDDNKMKSNKLYVKHK